MLEAEKAFKRSATLLAAGGLWIKQNSLADRIIDLKLQKLLKLWKKLLETFESQQSLSEDSA